MTFEFVGFLYFLWWLASGIDGVGALLAAFRLREIMKRPGVSPRAARVARGYSFFLYCLALESFFTLAALYFSSEDYLFPSVYMVLRLAGRTIKAIGVWYYVLYILGFGGDKPDAPKPTASSAVFVHSTEMSGKDARGESEGIE